MVMCDCARMRQSDATLNSLAPRFVDQLLRAHAGRRTQNGFRNENARGNQAAGVVVIQVDAELSFRLFL